MRNCQYGFRKNGGETMAKYVPTQFGISVKVKLLEMGRTQDWLSQECSKRTGMFVDSAVMRKLLSGTRKSPRIEAAIREILNLGENQEAS